MPKIIGSCPDWSLLYIGTKGHWTDPVYELFGEGDIPTHCHVYVSKAWADILPRLPKTVTTVSFDA